MRRHLTFRALVVGLLAGAALIAGAGPASAHTINGVKPTNYHSYIVSVTPATPGISVRIVDLGNKIELTNRTNTDVVVRGYDDEPYLRIGPTGVYENVHSRATYVNRGRNGGTVPPNVDTNPDAKPEWRKISSANSARWHDHRIHWMSSSPPPQVAAAPGRTFEISKQPITLEHDGRTIEVVVGLDWVPGPNAWVWLPVIVGLFLLAFFAAFLPRWAPVLIALIVVIVVVDAAHAIAYEVARPDANGTKVLRFLGQNFVSIAVWIAAGFTVVGIARRRIGALYGVVFVGVLVALIGGASDLASLWHSQLPTAGPKLLTRFEIAASLGLGVGMAAGALTRMVRSGRPDRARDGGGGGRWLSTLVVGLDDHELARIAADLDADDVLEVAYRELAGRLAPVAEVLHAGALVLDVTAETTAGTREHVWSIRENDDGAVVAARGDAGEGAATIHASFAVMLQLLAGTTTLERAIAAQRAHVDGDHTLIAAVSPYFSETSVHHAGAAAGRDDRAPAS